MPHSKRLGYYVRTGRKRRCPTYKTVVVRRINGYGRRVVVARRGGGRCYGWKKWTLRRRRA